MHTSPIRTIRRATAAIRLVRWLISRNRITEDDLMTAVETLNAASALLQAAPGQIDSAIANAQASDSPEVVTAASQVLTDAQAISDKLKGLQPVVAEPPAAGAAVDENGQPVPEGQTA